MPSGNLKNGIAISNVTTNVVIAIDTFHFKTVKHNKNRIIGTAAIKLDNTKLSNGLNV